MKIIDFIKGTAKASGLILVFALVGAILNSDSFIQGFMFFGIVSIAFFGYHLIIGVPLSVAWFYTNKYLFKNSSLKRWIFCSGILVYLVHILFLYGFTYIVRPEEITAKYGAPTYVTLPILIFPMFIVSLFFIKPSTTK